MAGKNRKSTASKPKTPVQPKPQFVVMPEHKAIIDEYFELWKVLSRHAKDRVHKNDILAQVRDQLCKKFSITDEGIRGSIPEVCLYVEICQYSSTLVLQRVRDYLNNHKRALKVKLLCVLPQLSGRSVYGQHHREEIAQALTDKGLTDKVERLAAWPGELTRMWKAMTPQQQQEWNKKAAKINLTGGDEHDKQTYVNYDFTRMPLTSLQNGRERVNEGHHRLSTYPVRTHGSYSVSMDMPRAC